MHSVGVGKTPGRRFFNCYLNLLQVYRSKATEQTPCSQPVQLSSQVTNHGMCFSLSSPDSEKKGGKRKKDLIIDLEIFRLHPFQFQSINPGVRKSMLFHHPSPISLEIVPLCPFHFLRFLKSRTERFCIVPVRLLIVMAFFPSIVGGWMVWV